VGQSRKVRLWVIYTTLLVQWVESRLRAMTDLVARVTDAAVLGMAARRGELALVQWYDHSGIVTGRVGGYPMGETMFRVRRVWGLFDTYAVRDPSEALARVEFLERPVAQVALGGAEDGDAPAKGPRGPRRRGQGGRARDGGRPPPEAWASAGEFEDGADSPRRFLEEKAEAVPGARIPFRAIRRQYEEWCRDRGIIPESDRLLADALRAFGCRRRRFRSVVVYEGLGLKGYQPSREESPAAARNARPA
jgi:hypothetical protein